MTGAVVYQFGYTSAGLLSTVTDGDGNVTTIERDSEGKPTAIVAPFGQRTVLAIDGNGYLSSVTDPAGQATTMTYSPDGLLQTFKDPNGHESQMSYDDMGRLTRDQNSNWGLATVIIEIARVSSNLRPSKQAYGQKNQVAFLFNEISEQRETQVLPYTADREPRGGGEPCQQT